MINYLTEKDIIKMNVHLISWQTPGEMTGVRYASALAMAVNQPRQEIFGQELYETIEEKAAILGINLIKKHPFQNANKRTAFMAMDVFLRLNQVKVSFKQNEAIDFVVKIATHDSEDFDQLKRSVVDTINDHMMN